jgi:hypothetical protein
MLLIYDKMGIFRPVFMAGRPFDAATSPSSQELHGRKTIFSCTVGVYVD